MSNLLLPSDERDLTEFLCTELGASLLLADVAHRGEPAAASEPVSALPQTLPLTAKPGLKQVTELAFWLKECGPIQLLSGTPGPQPAKALVPRLLSGNAAQAADVRIDDLIDFSRSPVLRLLRSHWHGPARLAPGEFGSMELPAAEVPQCVQRRYSQAQRWLRRRGHKLDPFDYCPEARARRPSQLGPLWVWVQPHALAEVRAGTEIWPWSA